MASSSSPLTGDSSIGTWIDDPIGGQIIRELLAQGGQSPDVMRPGGSGISPIRARDVTDLPEPDSPTMASVSPRRRSNEMFSTARVSPRWLEKSMVRLRTERMGWDTATRDEAEKSKDR